mmetsp:Transcript_34447/g.61909  ORF Transcript_34447/g.61909 Transcript_34447/m.61909 type:complete len:532 (-) Transcript_34447:57-1652(-)|eukprot:CAMPEP_0201957118 /NCGR_PEP_ID=MMETSP0904-20121228/4528_1 /ASSEMBLY_ACC=CAM_ASM_000553 /TAXON_ID=420261 /ORGANISM="Thalassiosira antarctica, Strain CCMP982" /LENGTH=531 /DNA_ID=CAMNT_0048502009 /DNA_START=53 /DNA_END=1648 /DNA_ORIENTATION=+
MATDSRIPSRLIIVAGTYDGVLAGWDTVEHTRDGDQNDIELKLLRRNDGRYLKLSFAMAAHEGSVRCIDVSAGAAVAAAANGIDMGALKDKEDAKETKEVVRKRQRSDSTDSITTPSPGTLLSGGYDENINVFNLQKHIQTGELKTPNDLGSPLCCSFAPPVSSASPPTHALVGLTSGKIVLYKKRDWSVQHVLSGHDEGGVHCLAVHPTGRMALTGGRDGKIILWDLMKGRLAFVHKLPKIKGRRKEAVNHIVWSDDGSRYAYCYGTKITARDVGRGEELLDVEMVSRVNQLAFIGGPEGMFVAAACDDGGLPVLEVGQLEESDEADTRRAIMAIEPVDRVVAGDDRFKCIRSVEGGSGFLVVTANSGGVVSLMDLEGAARMMLTGGSDGGDDEGKDSDDESDSDSDEDEETEAAVEILDSVRLGSGARITDLAVWSYGGEEDDEELDDNQENESDSEPSSSDDEDEKEAPVVEEVKQPPAKTKRGWKENKNDKEKVELSPEAVEKARELVGQAKKRQKKKKQKLAKKSE